MSFTFLPNIPAADDLISSSQSEIQENFQYLGDTTGNAVKGYYKLPNGLTIQWGNEGFDAGTWIVTSSGFISPNISYSISFPSAVYAVYLTGRVGDSESKRFVVGGSPGSTPTTSSFRIRSSTNSFDTIYWLAIGV